MLINIVETKQPHIVFIVADDYGYNDVGYHGSEIKTPVLDRLAAEGVKLENYYVQPICSPTRTQLMTGRYQIHTGTQHSLFWPLRPHGMPLSDPTFADKLREAGYSTHAVGKWHLGFFKREYLPMNRGFDSFFGILNGKADHFQYNVSAMSYNGLDLYDGIKKVNEVYRGQYSTSLYTKKTIELLEAHDKSKPLFVYVAFQAVHAPLQVPEQYLQQYQHITDEKRRLYAGMTSAMDEAVGQIVEAFKTRGLWNDTLLVFSTDNGGQVSEGGNNWPLRGWKGSLWEGGIKAVGFVHGAMLNIKGTVSKELIHVSDWFPTLIRVANGSLKGTNALDGVDQFKTISFGTKSGRQTILHNIDPLMPLVGTEHRSWPFDVRQRAALRHGDWKIITGDPGNGSWIVPPTVGSPLNAQKSKYYTRQKGKNVWLFNIKHDPFEMNDLSDSKAEVVQELLNMLANYSKSSVPCFYPDNDIMANPQIHGGYWGPWIISDIKYGSEMSSDFLYWSLFKSFIVIVTVVSMFLYCRRRNFRRSCRQQVHKCKV